MQFQDYWNLLMSVHIFPYQQSSKLDQIGVLETLSKAQEICPALSP